MDGEFYIGSADWMHRNLFNRVEVVAPVTARGPKAKLWEILDVCLRDRRQAWTLASDGSYSQLQPDGSTESCAALGSQATLQDLTRLRSDQ